jgi:hypothetical protein
MKNPDWQHMQKGAPERMKKWTPKAFEDFAQAENIYKNKKKRNKGWKRKEYWAKKQGWAPPQRPGAAPQEQQEGSQEEPPSKRAKYGAGDFVPQTPPPLGAVPTTPEPQSPTSDEEEVVYTGNSQEEIATPLAMAPPPARPAMSQSSRPLPPGLTAIAKAMPRQVPLYPRDAAGMTIHFQDGAHFFLPEHAANQLMNSIPRAKLEEWGQRYIHRPGKAVIKASAPLVEILDEEDEKKIRPWHRF